MRLLQGVDKTKDQTFFLSTVSQASSASNGSFLFQFLLLLQSMLKDTLFPVGGLTKKEVRDIAMKSGLQRVARKKEVGISHESRELVVEIYLLVS